MKNYSTSDLFSDFYIGYHLTDRAFMVIYFRTIQSIQNISFVIKIKIMQYFNYTGR